MKSKTNKVKTSKNSKKKIVEKIKAANFLDAIKKVKSLSEEKKRKFTESVDVAIVLGIDAKQSDQAVKGSVLLPNGLGKDVKVVAFVANDEQKNIALESGAIYAGLEDLIQKIEEGFYGFDCCVATPDVMQKISKVARKLGPRGLMPSPKNGTVTNDIKLAISDAKKGKVDFKNDKSGIVHCMLGKVDFSEDKLFENFNVLLKSVKDAKSDSVKGKFIKTLYISTTMGPSVEIAIDSI